MSGPAEQEEWYVARDRKREGPFTPAQLWRMASGGDLLPGDMIWLARTPRWVEARTQTWLFDPPAAVPLGPPVLPSPAEPAAPSPRERQGRQAGRRVALVDAYGAGNARASSGGHTRVIRMGYGEQEVYTRWSMRSLALWKSLFARIGRPALFQQAGVLWMARGQDPLTTSTLKTLQRLGVRHERLSRVEMDARWPQIDFGPNTWAIHEPESGFLMAFRSVQAVVEAATGGGVDYLQERIAPPAGGKGPLAAVAGGSGRTIQAGSTEQRLEEVAHLWLTLGGEDSAKQC